MKKIALIFPRMKYPSGDPPMGVSYLAAYLQKNNDISVEIIDTTFMRDPWLELKRKFIANHYDFVGVSVMTLQLEDTLRLIKIIKRLSPGTTIIVGGAHATVMPEEMLAAAPEIDILVVGEGEVVLDKILRGEPLRNIPSLYYRENGEIKITPRVTPCANLDDLPFPTRDLLPIKDYLAGWFMVEPYRGMSIITSRGCPYVCTFCQPTLRYIFGDKVRQRSPENVVQELKELKAKYNIEAFGLLDDTFNFSPAWVERFCNLLIQENLNLKWGCNTRANLADEEQMMLMKRAGLRKVCIGLESASQRILDQIFDKRITIEQARNAVKIAKRVGIDVQGFFILGAPSETHQEVINTIKYAIGLDIDYATFSICTPLPKTRLYDLTKELIKEGQTVDYYRYSIYKKGVTINSRTLNVYRRAALFFFYLHPKRIRRTLGFSFCSWMAFKRMLLKLKRF